MSRIKLHSIVLAALAAFSGLALADPPATVGRISSVQGRVTVAGDDDATDARLNWPVTGASRINTAGGARTEFRVGATAVRVDGDSELEVLEVDDDLLRLRLNYGGVSIRVRDRAALRDFLLSTPHARITMLEPGVLRVDSGRGADTTEVSVLAGAARVDGAGSSLAVNSGREVTVGSEDVRTGMARRDGFDDWAASRDRADDNAATRFVSSGMTGYEELDRNGSWTESVEYGALWTPRNVAADWAPYRDGSWIWLSPWGWTWIDNAPWGYAPSHYGRWVMAGNRWRWAPGRAPGRPVWAPALVGWVGAERPDRRGPGLGWFPLSPRERYVPAYRVSADHERRLSWTHDGKPMAYAQQRAGQPQGLTILPREQFEGRRAVPVQRGPQVIPSANTVREAVAVTPPRPPAAPRRLETSRPGLEDRDHDGRPDRFQRNDRNDRDERDGGRDERGLRNTDRGGQPGRVIATQPPPQQQPVQQPMRQPAQVQPQSQPQPPSQPQSPQPMNGRPAFVQSPGQAGGQNPQQQPGRQEDTRPNFRPGQSAPMVLAPNVTAATPATLSMPATPVAPAAAQPAQNDRARQERGERERFERNDGNGNAGERRQRVPDVEQREQRPQFTQRQAPQQVQQQQIPQAPQVQPQQQPQIQRPQVQPQQQAQPPVQRQQPQQQEQNRGERKEGEKRRNENTDRNHSERVQ